MQFDLPPTHEAAMFLKTWLELRMKAWHAWGWTPTELESALKGQMGVFKADFSQWSKFDIYPFEYFEKYFQENMKRCPKDENR